MTDPNPWSRESSFEPPQAAAAGQPGGADSGSWPSYPAAPNSFGYDRDEIVDYETTNAPVVNPYEPPGSAGYGYPQGTAYPTGTAYPAAYPSTYPSAPSYDTSPYAASYGSSYATSPYGPSAYAAGPYGYTPASHPQAIPAMVLGIIGLVICPWVSIAALVIGGRARKAILAEPQRYSGLGLATAGWVIGIVGTAYAALFTVFLVLGFSGALDS